MSATTSASQSNSTNGRVKPAEPINLSEQFGDRYRIEWDPAYFAEYGPSAKVDDPWLQTVPGRLGHIFPHGNGLLAASSNSRGPVANKLAGIAGATVIQDGDDGLTIAFPASSFRTVAKIIRAHTCRRLTDAQRQALKEAGEAYRFTMRSAGENRAHQAPDK
jgi:hypothetical protein